jgi:hypothetical protein
MLSIKKERKQEANIETAEMKFLRNVGDYTEKDQIRNTNIREELNILIQIIQF